MTRNPLVNALTAVLYIAAVASIMQFGPPMLDDSLETILLPIAFLSLFSLSAAVMAFLFFYQPVRLFLEGEKDAALKLALRTIGVFAVITILLLGATFSSPLWL